MEDKIAANDRLVPLRVVLAAVGVGSSTIYRWIAAGTFPKPRVLSKRCVRWVWADVNEWIDNLPTAHVKNASVGPKISTSTACSPKSLNQRTSYIVQS